MNAYPHRRMPLPDRAPTPTRSILLEFSNNLPCRLSISEGHQDLIENDVVEYLVSGGLQSFGETFSVSASSFN
jgi:hypothetical protein